MRSLVTTLTHSFKMLRIVLCLFLVATSTCSYGPFCQNWCNGQQPIIDPQACGTYCRGSYDPCSSGYPYPYPVNPIYPGIPIGPSLPGFPAGPSSPGIPYGPSFPGVPVGPSFPGNPVGWPGLNTIPNIPVGTDPIRVVVDTLKNNEWICPVDPQPRAGEISGNLPPKLTACEYDENCASSPVRQKCCYDQGIGDKVCKPAVLA